MPIEKIVNPIKDQISGHVNNFKHNQAFKFSYITAFEA